MSDRLSYVTSPSFVKVTFVGYHLVRGEKEKTVNDRQTTLSENGVRGDSPCQTAKKGRRPMSDRWSYVTPTSFVRRTFVG